MAQAPLCSGPDPHRPFHPSKGVGTLRSRNPDRSPHRLASPRTVGHQRPRPARNLRPVPLSRATVVLARIHCPAPSPAHEETVRDRTARGEALARRGDYLQAICGDP